jgi:hypothetical protein
LSMPARQRRQVTAAKVSERPLLVFDFHGRPVAPALKAPKAAEQPQSIRDAVLAWLDEQL